MVRQKEETKEDYLDRLRERFPFGKSAHGFARSRVHGKVRRMTVGLYCPVGEISRHQAAS